MLGRDFFLVCLENSNLVDKNNENGGKICILARFTPFLLSFRPTLLKNGVLLHWIQDSQHIRCPYLTMIKQIHTN